MFLEASWNLKETINKLKFPKEIKVEIDKWEDIESTGIDHRFSNIIYRSNLHYIIDNKDKANLLDELKNLNNIL